MGKREIRKRIEKKNLKTDLKERFSMKYGNKQKFIALLFSALLLAAVLGFSACSSKGPYAESVSADEESSRVRDLNLKEVFSETEGYHFPGFSWGGNFEKFQTDTNYPVTDFVSYLEDGGRVYEAGHLHFELCGRVNDDGEVKTDYQEKVVSVSIAFREGSKNTVDEETLFTNYLQTLQKELGQETRYEETVLDIPSAHYRLCTYYWEYTISDGTVTRLQWSKATLGGAEKPEYVCLGFSVVVPEEE